MKKQMVEPLIIHLTKRLREIASSFYRYSRYLHEHHQITIPQVVCLREVYEHGPLPLGKLTKIVGLSNSTVTGIVDRLERQQLLERIRTSTDRRQIHLRMTEKGIQFLKDIPTPVPEQFVEGIGRYSKEEVERIVWAVDELADLLGTFHHRTATPAEDLPAAQWLSEEEPAKTPQEASSQDSV